MSHDEGTNFVLMGYTADTLSFDYTNISTSLTTVIGGANYVRLIHLKLTTKVIGLKLSTYTF